MTDDIHRVKEVYHVKIVYFFLGQFVFSIFFSDLLVYIHFFFFLSLTFYKSLNLCILIYKILNTLENISFIHNLINIPFLGLDGDYKII